MHADNPTSSKIVPLPGSITLLISVCFFLSGLAGLIYEVVWARQLSLFLGITSFAHTAVITAYMAGLAAGSLFFGRWADRHTEPLKMYAWLEIGVGVYAALTPWLFTTLQYGYVAVTDVSSIGTMNGHLTRFVIALLALLIPTFLMGGTLPLLVRGFVSELPAMGKVTGRFYGINTLGATVGTLLAGYLLIPALGVKATIFAGVVINLAVAAVVFVVLKRPRLENIAARQARESSTQSKPAPEERLSPGLRNVILVGFGTAGFAALLSQMAWLRALILVVGGSVYAFTITLASFLAGIGLGSLLYMRYLAKPKGWLARSWMSKRMVQAAFLAFLISLTLLLGLPVIGKLPGWFVAGYSAGLHNNFTLFQLFVFTLCSSMIILPTLFMGILFPLVTAIWTRGVDRAGRGVGVAYAINTTGTILGALFGGLFVLPWLGVHYSIQMAAGLYFLVAVAFWFVSATGNLQVQRYRTAGIALLLLMSVAWLIPPWNKALMTGGVFVSPGEIVRQLPRNSLQQLVEKRRLLYYNEGIDGIVAVKESDDNRVLVINGKVDASSKHDLPTQVMLGQLPLALKPGAQSALVIGLGSGITAGTLATSPSLEDLVILEISKEVIEASAFFLTENYKVLLDHRVNLVTADARNYMMASSEYYDLIVSEPSNPRITGISNLFTDEFFKLAKSRLNSGGVMTQWFHTYSMSNENLKTVLKTFENNFKYVSVWSPMFEDMVIIGSDQPYEISLANAPGVNTHIRDKELERAQVYSDRDLIRLYIFGGVELSEYIGNSKINSDDHPIIEFSAPKHLYLPTVRQNLEDIFEFLQGQAEPVPVARMVSQTSDFLDAHFMNLRIATGKRTSAENVFPEWLISQLLLEENGRRTYGMIGTERVLKWNEGPARFLLTAIWQPSAPTSAEMQGMLDKWNDDAGRLGGFVHRLDGVDAMWLMDTNGVSSQIGLDIIWNCKTPDEGVTQFSLQTAVPDPGQDARGIVAERLFSRFQCNP